MGRDSGYRDLAPCLSSNVEEESDSRVNRTCCAVVEAFF